MYAVNEKTQKYIPISEKKRKEVGCGTHTHKAYTHTSLTTTVLIE